MKTTDNWLLYGIFALLLVGAGLVYAGVISPGAFMEGLLAPSYTYKVVDQGVSFVSNDAPLNEIIPFLAAKQSFVLSPGGFAQEGAELNSYMTQALIQGQVVLVGHQKITLTALKVYDPASKQWVGCQTDFGTAKQSVFISVSECQGLLSPNEGVVFEVLLPNPNLPTPRVEFQVNRIIITPTRAQDIPGLNFLVLRLMYSDAPTLIALSNQALENNNSTPAPAEVVDENITIFPGTETQDANAP